MSNMSKESAQTKPNEILESYKDLSDKCDRILKRIKEKNKKQSSPKQGK